MTASKSGTCATDDRNKNFKSSYKLRNLTKGFNRNSVHGAVESDFASLFFYVTIVMKSVTEFCKSALRNTTMTLHYITVLIRTNQQLKVTHTHTHAHTYTQSDDSLTPSMNNSHLYSQRINSLYKRLKKYNIYI